MAETLAARRIAPGAVVGPVGAGSPTATPAAEGTRWRAAAGPPAADPTSRMLGDGPPGSGYQGDGNPPADAHGDHHRAGVGTVGELAATTSWPIVIKSDAPAALSRPTADCHPRPIAASQPVSATPAKPTEKAVNVSQSTAVPGPGWPAGRRG